MDSGASYSVTPLASVFIEGTFIPQPSIVNQFSSTVVVSVFGQAYWRFSPSNTNKPVDRLPTNTYIINSPRICIFNRQANLKQMNQGEVILNPQSCLLHLPGGRSHMNPYNNTNNIPLLQPLPLSDAPPSASVHSLFSFNSL